MNTSNAPKVDARLSLAERLLMERILLPGYTHVPQALRMLRPLLVRMIWSVTPSLRRSLLRNAAVLIGESASTKEKRNFALDVLSEIQRFTDEMVQGARRQHDAKRPKVICDGDVDGYFARRNKGDGMVLATAHMGSFEASASVLQDMEPCIHVLYARDPCPSMELIRSQLRKRFGVVEHAVDDGLETWTALRDALGDNEIVALPADRVQPGQVGFEIDLLGQKTHLPAGPFKLAMTTGAPLAPIFCWRDQDGTYRLTVDTPIEFEGSFTRDLAKHPGIRAFVQSFEQLLRRCPTQWMMVHEAWPQNAMRVAS